MPVANLIAEARPLLRNRLFPLFKFIILRCTVFLTRTRLTKRQRAWRGTEMSYILRRILPCLGSSCSLLACIGFLGLALKSLPVGTAYAVWTGIGTIGTTALGIYLFNEPATLLRLACIGLILSGIIGLKITS